MNLRFQKRPNSALTILEVLVVIAILVVLAVLFLPMEPHVKSRAPRIQCVSNLKQVNIALRIWEGDHNNKYPMAVSITNGGGMELIDRGDVAGCLRAASNELSTPKILICPADTDHICATDFGTDFDNSHISYFISPDANETYPQMIMSGDDNLATNGVPLKSGIVDSALSMTWTATRHINVGNIGYADGSISEVSNIGLQQAIILGTNGTPGISRFAIP